MQRATYPVRRSLGAGNRLHDAALLVGHVAHPVRLARRDQDVCAPPLDEPVQLVILVDLEPLGVLHRAAVAVAVAVLAVDGLVDDREQVLQRRLAARVADGERLGAVDERFERRCHLGFVRKVLGKKKPGELLCWSWSWSWPNPPGGTGRWR